METKDLNSRLVDMTLGEAIEIATPFLTKLLGKIVQDNLDGKGEDIQAFGLEAIMSEFDCGKTKAVAIHHDKRFGAAFYNDGRKICVNVTKLREIKQKLAEEETRRRMRIK